MGAGAAGSLQRVHGVGTSVVAGRSGPTRRRRRSPGVLLARFALLCLVAVAVGMAAPPDAVGPAAAQEPEPSPTTPEPTTTAPPTTVPTTVPTTEAPTTVPTTEAPAPTAPPTTSGGGGGPIRPAVSSSVTTTEAPTTTSTTESPTVVAPTPGAVTVPSPADAEAVDEPSGPWLTPDVQLRIAVGGLIALALVMVVLTVAYWRHTRPRTPTPLVGLADAADDLAVDPFLPEAVAGPPPDLASSDSGVPPAQQGEDATAGGSPAPTPLVGFSAAPPSALPPPSLGRRPTRGADPPRTGE